MTQEEITEPGSEPVAAKADSAGGIDDAQPAEEAGVEEESWQDAEPEQEPEPESGEDAEAAEPYIKTNFEELVVKRDIPGRYWFNAALLLLIFATFAQLLAWRSAEVAQQAETTLRAIVVSTTDLQLAAERSVSGDSDSVEYLSATSARMNNLVSSFEWDNALDAAIAGFSGIDNRAITYRWRNLENELQTITREEPAVRSIYDGADSVDIIGPVLIASVDEVAGKVGLRTGDVEVLDAAADLRAITQKLIKEVMLVIVGSDRAADALEQIDKGVQFFEITLANLAARHAQRLPEEFEILEDAYGEFSVITDQISEVGPSFLAARAALGQVQPMAESLRAQAQSTSGRVELLSLLSWAPWVLAILGGLALLTSHMLVSRAAQENANLARYSARSGFEAQEHQESILKLLDEIAALADGDLTIEAEVTDQITGAIADSVNYAIFEMRELVSRIQSAAEQLGGEAENAMHQSELLVTTNHQHAGRIVRMAEDLDKVAQEIERFSSAAQQSTTVAGETLQIAEIGGAVVAKSIDGMNSIRERIQETSKRIKRLGEGSQEIGEIVSMIEELAEQTNILSLNASIKAAVGSSSTSGFASVAEEVQTLAERSAEAARKISELVVRIQKDTHNAIHAMELATGEVVAGAKMTDEAGQALTRIRRASGQMTKLVTSIADHAEQKAAQVRQVSTDAIEIKSQSENSAERVRAATEEVGKLSLLAEQLKEYVARFKVPPGA